MRLASLFSAIDSELSIGTITIREACTSNSCLPFTISSVVSGSNLRNCGSWSLVLILTSVVGDALGFLRCLQESNDFTLNSISLVGLSNSASDLGLRDSLDEAID